MSKKKLAEAKSKIENLEFQSSCLRQQVDSVKQAYLLLSKHNDEMLLHINLMNTPKQKPSLWKRIFK